MEVIEPVWLNEAHPNYVKWKKGRDIAVERGKFAVSIIEQYKKCASLNILDLGSGEGGTAAFLSFKNKVVSTDISFTRLKRQSAFRYKYKINADALNLPFKKNSFDIIILQDVIEHIQGNESLLLDLSDLLKWDGIIYLSTPNKYSVFNIISDPHWGLPFLCLYKRHKIRTIFLNRFRKKDAERKDIAELQSLDDILFQTSIKYKMYINTVYAVQELFSGNSGIVWSDFHLFLIKTAHFLKLSKLIIKLSNDKPQILNKYFTPTFYLVMTKINSDSV